MASGTPITIGLVTSLTGPYAALGKGDVQGLGIAVKKVNAAGGIKGRKINLVTKNDKSKSS